MMNRNASLRLGRVKPPPAATDDPRVRVDIAHLRALETRAKALRFLPRQPVHSVLNGRHASRLRGRGLNFEELRGYLPGDDIRAIDWKVTARAGEPYIRVMTEERDRPTLIVVDQRMSMFFGSVLNMKSITAAEAAALSAYRIFDQGDRVGGIVFTDDKIAEIKPARSRATLSRFVAILAEANAQLHAEAPKTNPIRLTDVLRAVARIAPRDHLIVVLSDFDVIDAETERLVSGLSRRNDLILGLITDPFAKDLPRDLSLIISDGALQAEIKTSDSIQHAALREFASARVAQVLDWQRRFGVPVLPLTAAEETLPQIRHLMGLGPK